MTPGFHVPQWTRDAACNSPEVDAEIFFTKSAEDQARKVCLGCPVRHLCLAEFLTDPWAFAGGLSAEERASLRRKRLL